MLLTLVYPAQSSSLLCKSGSHPSSHCRSVFPEKVQPVSSSICCCDRNSWWGGELASPFPVWEVLLEKPNRVRHLPGPGASRSASGRAAGGDDPAVKDQEWVSYRGSIRCHREVPGQLQKPMRSGRGSLKHSARSCCDRRWSTGPPCAKPSCPLQPDPRISLSSYIYIFCLFLSL